MSSREEPPVTTDGVTGVDFVDCDLVDGASTQGQPRRREVVVNGRRVKTVDIHAHCAVPEAMDRFGRKADRPGLLMSQMADRIQAMDEQGIDVEALSINPYWYGADRDLAYEVIRIQNEKLAEAGKPPLKEPPTQPSASPAPGNGSQS